MTSSPPSPPKALIGGHLFKMRQNAHEFLLDNLHRCGDVAALDFAGYTVYQINHPDLIQQVLTKQAKSFHKARIYKRLLSLYLGNGLLISDGDFWKRQRKLAQPAFHTQRIHAYADTMVAYTQDMLAAWQPGQVRDIDDEMMQLTLRIVGKTLFDVDLAMASHDVAQALEGMVKEIPNMALRIVRPPAWLPTPMRRRREHTNDLLNTLFANIIEERRQHNADQGDLLSMLMLARDDNDEGMTDQQLRDEVLTIVLAGHETTANALAWTLYLLAQHPGILQRLQAEVAAVLADRPATLADLAHLPYTEMVIKEGLRLYPPAWSFARQAIEAVQIGDYHIPADAGVMLSPYVVHRHPDFWEDPDRFDPERFSAANEPAIHKYAYFPFGGGPRICIGSSFAMMEACLILATLMQHVGVENLPGQHVQPEALVTLRPKNGMQLRLSQAQGQPTAQPV